MRKKSIVLFIPSVNIGGVEKVFILLAKSFLESNFRVFMVIGGKEEGGLITSIPREVKTIWTGSTHLRYSFWVLCRLLKKISPDIALSGMSHSNIILILAKLFTRISTRIYISEHCLLGFRLTPEYMLKEKIVLFLAKYLYRYADGIIAVSEGIKKDLCELLNIPTEEICVIHNPLDINDICRQALESIEHPFFTDKSSPVIIAVGRLNPLKGYPVLLVAFERVIKEIDSRLIIVGGRNDQYLQELKTLVSGLGIAQKVSFVGEQSNPYAYMFQSDLFVLASNTEGFGVVLIEALACSLPVVATATAGAIEVLANGQYGQLVPVGDSRKLASSIIKELKNQRQNNQFDDYVNQFERSQIVKLYISYMLQNSKRNQHINATRNV